ncbi:YuzF family protein [Alkalihalobacillus sp. MEB130]|uniref:YuzF family protein n=1 Tax=Alkalihalobacillus sp. MEB130 TaxID=2976704 RepID=UPI0028DECE7E|nr:YuzF family protein [Alkalihalobacillus sp. MEB130]MDT8860595.1 YuzF family protein [Alkalihalobacillus sp. MEB130]
MHYQNIPPKSTDQTVPQMVAGVDPFMIQTLQSLLHSNVVIQTTEGLVRGIVADVKADHVVIDVKNCPFFVRIQQIVWVKPSVYREEE